MEARFAHLLQPIRDLTKNWEVDVAAQLGEYLEELDQICISFDEGKTTMNFIEAALLIQGSACVYSKKVEYLYSLVYQALDFISGKRRAKQLSSVQEDRASGDASSGAPRRQRMSSCRWMTSLTPGLTWISRTIRRPARSSSSPSCPWPWWPLMKWRRTTIPCTAVRVRSWPAGRISG